MDGYIQGQVTTDQFPELRGLADMLTGTQGDFLGVDTRCLLLSQVLERFGKIVLPFVGASMLPTIPRRANVLLERVDSEFLKPGDIVLFRKKDQIVAHRIVQMRTNDRECLFFAVGDNQGSDGWINSSSILGKITDVRFDNAICRENPLSKFGLMTEYWLVRGRIIGFIEGQRWLSRNAQAYLRSLVIRAFRQYPKWRLRVELGLNKSNPLSTARDLWGDSLRRIRKEDKRRTSIESRSNDLLELRSGMVLIEGRSGGLLLDQERGNLNVLNTVGFLILKSCNGEHTSIEILQTIMSRSSPIRTQDIKKGVCNFLTRMIREGIVLHRPATR